MPKVLTMQLEDSYISKMIPAALYNTDHKFVTTVLTENINNFIKILVTYI